MKEISSRSVHCIASKHLYYIHSKLDPIQSITSQTNRSKFKYTYLNLWMPLTVTMVLVHIKRKAKVTLPDNQITMVKLFLPFFYTLTMFFPSTIHREEPNVYSTSSWGILKSHTLAINHPSWSFITDYQGELFLSISRV